MHDGFAPGADAMSRIAQPKFWSGFSSFDAFQSVTGEFAAVQRGWRDFRIAQ
jgi:hypothetical protein